MLQDLSLIMCVVQGIKSCMDVSDVAALVENVRTVEMIGLNVFWGREFLLLGQIMVKLKSRGAHIKMFKLRCASLGI
jgi:hypothetical protein